MNRGYTDKGIRNLDTGRKIATGVGTAVGAAKAAVGLGLIAKSTAVGSAAGPIGTAAGLVAGLTAAGISAISGKKKKKRAQYKYDQEQKSLNATEAGNKRIGRNNDGYGLSNDPNAPSADINAPLPGEVNAPAVPDAKTVEPSVNRFDKEYNIDPSVMIQDKVLDKDFRPTPNYGDYGKGNLPVDIDTKALDSKYKDNSLEIASQNPTDTRVDTGVDTGSLVNPEVTNAMTTASKLDTAGNLINSGVAVAGLINSMNAKPVEKVHTQITKAPKEPERIDDNTEAIRAMAESQVQGNLGAAEKQMIEMGVNPAMAQSIKTSQGNQASLGINANLAQNKQTIQAANAQMGNQHEQFATQVGMQNAQSINQTGQFNAQNQAMANQYNSQALMQSLAALGKNTSNIGKIKLDKALMYGDLEMNALQQAYFKKMMGVN